MLIAFPGMIKLNILSTRGVCSQYTQVTFLMELKLIGGQVAHCRQ